MAMNLLSFPAETATTPFPMTMERHQRAASFRLFACLTLLASIAAFAPTTAPAPEAPTQARTIGQFVSGESVAYRAGPFTASGLGLAQPQSIQLAQPQVQPELLRIQGGVTYQPQTRPEVYFTFDDGPDHVGVTDQILDLLDQYEAKATFFVVGRAAEAFPGQIQRIVDEGHSLANHTYSHPRLTGLSDDGVRQELTKASTVLRDLSGHSVHCYRPPEGKVNDRIHAIAVDVGLGNEGWTADWGGHWGLWDVDTWDWRRGRERTLNAMETISEGDVVLMHSLSSFSAEIFQEWMEDNHERFDFEVLPGCMEPLVVTPHNGL